MGIYKLPIVGYERTKIGPRCLAEEIIVSPFLEREGGVVVLVDQTRRIPMFKPSSGALAICQHKHKKI
jgi:hypothetical protein